MAEQFEADVVIVGAGVAGTLVGWSLARAGARVLILEAGPAVDRAQAVKTFRAALAKAPNAPYPDVPYAPRPKVTDLRGYYVQAGPDLFKSAYERQVGGTTWHWNATAMRHLPSDFALRSRYGVGVDWPITYAQLEPWYVAAEQQLGVAGDDGADFGSPRSQRYPLPPIAQTYLDRQVKAAAATIGIPVLPTPQARNSMSFQGRPACCGNSTCVPLCPIGAKYDASGFYCVVWCCDTLTVIDGWMVEGTMADTVRTCPGCGSAATRKDGRDRRGQQRFRCGACLCRFAALTGTPFAGYRFPPDIIALAVRWYLRFRLSYADVAELLAERGVRVDPSTIFAWVREFAPLYEDAARSFRRAIGSCWSVDETYTKVAGKPAYVYRAIDGRGQVVDVYVSTRRATADAATFFRRAIEATGVVPDEVMTDGAAAYPPALAAVLPGVLHEMGKQIQQRIERDHQHLKGRLRLLRGFKTLVGARVLCRAHAFLRNLRGGFYDLGHLVDDTVRAPQPPVMQAWAALTGALLGR
jgi:transposase-like protein